MVNMSSSHQTTATTTPRSNFLSNSSSQQNPLSHSTIDDFREIIREQSFILPNNSTSDAEHVDVPVKKYPPLPDIAVTQFTSSHAPFFRTEATLSSSTRSNVPKRQMFYHFARPQRTHLPSINKISMPQSLSNMMDLDESLPECYTRIPNRPETYTSPNDRLSSPIKRPSAPSPPASAHIKRAGQNAFVNRDDDEDEHNLDDQSEYDDIESQLFEENFYHRYEQPTQSRRPAAPMSTNRYLNLNEQDNSLLIYDDPTSSFSALDIQR